MRKDCTLRALSSDEHRGRGQVNNILRPSEGDCNLLQGVEKMKQEETAINACRAISLTIRVRASLEEINVETPNESVASHVLLFPCAIIPWFD